MAVADFVAEFLSDRRVIETTVMRALFPRDDERRKFLRSVGASTAWAAISPCMRCGPFNR